MEKYGSLTLGNHLQFFKGVKNGDLFTYSMSFDLKTVIKMGSDHGFRIDYCGPETPEYDLFGSLTCRAFSINAVPKKDPVVYVVNGESGQWGEYHKWVEGVFADEEIAKAHAIWCRERYEVRVRLMVAIHELDKLFGEANPPPYRTFPKPEKPKMKPGQSHQDHTRENIVPWKAAVAMWADDVNALMDAWGERLNKSHLPFFTEHAEEMKKYGLTPEDISAYVSDDDPKYSVKQYKVRSTVGFKKTEEDGN